MSEIYLPKIQAAIADRFRNIDKSGRHDLFAPHFLDGRFQSDFGPLNFAGLEQVFRNHHFNTHILAVPIGIVSKRIGNELIAVLPEDALKIYNSGKGVKSMAEILSLVQTLPYTIYTYSGLEKIKAGAADWGFEYDAATNIDDLGFSGIAVPKPGTPLAMMMSGMARRN